MTVALLCGLDIGLKRTVKVSGPKILNILIIFYKQFIIGLIQYLPSEVIAYKYREFGKLLCTRLQCIVIAHARLMN